MKPNYLPSVKKLNERGFSTFPLEHHSKRPVQGSHGCLDARLDWTDWPDGANIGIATGPRSGVWVLDLDDAPEGGLAGWEAVEEIEELYQERLPLTLTATTPRGGFHLYWRWPGSWADDRRITVRSHIRLATTSPARATALTGLSASGMGGYETGMDTRGDGGYVVAPPSMVRVEKGPYTGQIRPYSWMVRTPPVLAPDWLIRLVLPPPLPPIQERRNFPGRSHPYALAVLGSACDACRSCGGGCHHKTWYTQALLVGGYVGGGHLAREEAEVRLVEAAEGSTKGRRREIRRTIAAGLDSGIARPCHPPER